MSAPRKASRRERQAANLHSKAAQVTDFPNLVAYMDRYGPNTTAAVMVGTRAAICPLAGGTEGPAILWPVHHPNDILKSGKRGVIGVYWSDPDTGVIQDKKGKTFIDRRAGGLLFGSIEGASTTIYITADPYLGLAVHGATGQPVLVLFTPGGLKGIGEQTIRAVGAAGLAATILVKHEHADSAAACAFQIRVTAPQVAVTISPFATWGDDWLDNLAEAAFLEAKAAPPKPRENCCDDFLATPDLTGGPLGPEPPPCDYQQPRNVIPIIPWRPRTVPDPEQARQVFPNKDAALETALAFLREAVRGAYVPLAERQEANEAGRPARKPIPYLIRAAAGFGKTTLLTAILREVGLPAFWLSPTKAHAEEIAVALASRLWDGRSNANCLRFDTVESLTERGRSPHANACRTCPHGNKESGAARCEFIQNLADAIYDLMIVGQHGAGGYDSTLLQYEDKEQQGPDEGRLQIIDEKVPTEARTEIALADIQSAHATAVRAAAFWKDMAGRREEVKKVSAAQGASADLLAARDDEIAAARETHAWCQGMVAGLADLAAFMGELGAAPPEGQAALTDVDKVRFKAFMKLAAHPPKPCLSTDATILEKVEQIWGKAPIIPLRWIQPLGKAIKAGTAWKIGDKILASNVSGLWKRLLKKGGILLDATSTRAAEIEAAGGKVLDIQIATPNLKTVLWAGHLHGKSGLPRPGQPSTERLEEMVAQIKAMLTRYPDAVVITHKPIATAMKDERVRHWGTHRAHNDWSKKKHLILFGLPLLSPDEQIIQYAVYRAVMARRGIELAPWNGERCKEMVPMGQWEILPAAQLPAVKDARDWLLGELNAEVAQAIGRLRAVQRPGESLLVEIYGFLPIVGHGLKVDEIRLENHGRLYNKTKIRAALAAGVVELGEQRTRAKLVAFIKGHTGVRISDGEASTLLQDLKAQAVTAGVTLDQAARESCAINSRLLEAGHEPQAIAAAAREIGGLPGVVAIAEILDKHRRAPGVAGIAHMTDQTKRAPGAQRAGP